MAYLIAIVWAASAVLIFIPPPFLSEDTPEVIYVDETHITETLTMRNN